jgi:hypothetical protein
MSVVVLAPWACAVCQGPRTSRSRGEVERGGDLSCETETCRDLSCRDLVGDAAIWTETGRLASVGLDRGPQPSSSRILAFTLSMVLGYLVFKENPFTVKGALIWALVNRPLKLRLTCTLPMSPSTRNINLCFILFFLIPSMHAMHFSL